MSSIYGNMKNLVGVNFTSIGIKLDLKVFCVKFHLTNGGNIRIVVSIIAVSMNDASFSDI